jgi:nucleotide-binding universal stress UspA family protein
LIRIKATSFAAPILSVRRTNPGGSVMGFATLMVHLELGRPNTAILTIAADLAERMNANVIGIGICQPARLLYNDGYIPANVLEQERTEIADEMKAAEAELRAALAPRPDSVDWRSAVVYTPLSEHLAQEACRADVVITGVDRTTSLFDMSHHVDIGDFVMRAGRPCLIVPNGIDALPLKHVVAGWKDTGETRRAVRDALPLMKLAGRVTLVSIVPKDEVDTAHARLGDVAAWLKRHGIDVDALVTASTGDDAARLDAIMAEQGADLLVAGAYGHSRVREWALGGVTRDLLLRGTRCSLVSH